MEAGDQIKTPAVLYRGGTSKAFFVWRDDLPSLDKAGIDQWILAIYGSPDRRQIDGVGGAEGLTSKFAIIGPPTHPDADVDYHFAQVGINEAVIDWSLICGNMSAAVGPYAIERGLVPPQSPATTVRIHSVNTGKILRAVVPVTGGLPDVIGPLRIDGVPGSGAPIELDLSETVSTQGLGLLPTGNVRDVITVPGFGDVEVSIVDAALPCMFVRAERFAFTGAEGPLELEAQPEKLQAVDAVRRIVAARLGWASSAEAALVESPLTPAIMLVSAPQPWTEFDTRLERDASECDLTSRNVSRRMAHRAYPVTGSISTGVAAALKGSVVHDLVRPQAHSVGRYRIAHPSGAIDVVIEVQQDGPAVIVRKSAVLRTARRLLEGAVYASRDRLSLSTGVGR